MIERLSEAAGRPVSRETFEKLRTYVELLEEESRRQNLISASSLETVWERHILDSAQLVRFEPNAGASWCDIGSGAGFPGIVIACLAGGPVMLVEPRRLRAEFLHSVVGSLRLAAAVEPKRAQAVTGSFDVITARAVAPLPRLLEISLHLSTGKTVWALPRGRSAQAELAAVRQTWQGVFHVERSVSDPDSYILVGTGVRAKQR